MGETLIHKDNRLAWLDNLNAFSIFFLFWRHCCGCFTSDTFNMFCIAWRMPLFVFVSGYTSISLKNKIHNWTDVDAYIQKLAIRIGLPNLLFTTLSMATGYGLQHRWERMGISLMGTMFFLFVGYLFYSQRVKKGRLIKYMLIVLSHVTTPMWYLPFIMDTKIAFVFSQLIAKKYFNNSVLVFLLVFIPIMMLFPSPFHATAEFAIIFLLALFAHGKHDYLLKIYHRVKLPGLLILFMICFAIGWLALSKYGRLEAHLQFSV